ncbi:hypothetical protein DFP73DRAFT_543361 [Morchella snyderi]|nr:hypothetical protein DFP73DRAFT_543361 [Morchella snyderi]
MSNRSLTPTLISAQSVRSSTLLRHIIATSHGAITHPHHRVSDSRPRNWHWLRWTSPVQHFFFFFSFLLLPFPFTPQIISANESMVRTCSPPPLCSVDNVDSIEREFGQSHIFSQWHVTAHRYVYRPPCDRVTKRRVAGANISSSLFRAR